MVNRYRGEISAMIDGREATLCLTLGAMAELEDAFGVDSFAALLARIAEAKLSARQITAILGAGLRGAGHDYTDADIAALSIPGGIAAMTAIALELLNATFIVEPSPTSRRDPHLPQNP